MAALEEGFYVYLPSSVKSSLFDNTTARFCSRFAAPIRLHAGNAYEAGLVKLIYPSTAKNVYDGRIEYYSYELKRPMVTRVQAGHYEIPEEFIQAFSKALGYDAEYYKLTGVPQTQKFILQCVPPPKATAEPFMTLSKNLQALTGLPESVHRKGYHTGDAWDVDGGSSNMYIYCDILKNSVIGDTSAPILSVVKYEGESNGKSAVEYEPLHIIYAPLSKDYLDSVTIEIRTKTGQLFPFMSGETILLLHIKAQYPM